MYYCWDVKIFEAAAIENFVKYKAGDAINYFYVYSLPYLVYMLFLTWINPQSVFTVSIFFLIQVALLFLDIYYRGAKVLAMAMQIVDLLRLVAMGILCFKYYVLAGRAEIMTLANMFSFVNFFSWISVIKYLRRAPGVRGYIPLLEASLKSLLNFTVIILLFMVSFGTSIRIKAVILKQGNDGAASQGENSFGPESLVANIVNQYRFMFADFSAWDSHEADADAIDYLYALGLTFIISVVLFNLIVSIFTDTYGDLKEDQAAEDIRMLNEVVMDVEYFTFYLFKGCFFLRSYSAE